MSGDRLQSVVKDRCFVSKLLSIGGVGFVELRMTATVLKTTG